MRTVPFSLAIAGVLACADPAAALAMKVGSRDCGSPPLSSTLGVEVTLAPEIVDPFLEEFDDPLIAFLPGSLALCPDAFTDLDSDPLTGISLTFDFGADEFDPDFSIAPDSAWSGFAFDPTTGLLRLFPLLDESPLFFDERLPDLAIEFLCENDVDQLCNPFVGLVEGPVTVQIESFSTEVPEPATLVLLGTGLLAVAVRSRRRRVRRQSGREG